jgi:hypothetical protein
MKTSLFVFIALFYGTLLFSQKKKTITVRAGNNIMDVLTAAEVFYYPVFTDGAVFLRDGSKVRSKLNYSRLVDEIHFIGPAGDTLALANEETVKYVVIGSDTFQYDKGYVRLISQGRRVNVAQKRVWAISETKQLGAYNTTSSTASITSFTTYRQAGRLYDLVVNADVVLSEIEQFYLSNRNQHYLLAGKRNLLLLFPKEENAIQGYLKTNKVDFTSPEHLKKLADFIEQL